MRVVVLDACVLYPAPLRDLLMHLALADLFRAKWTAQIHDEWIRNVLRSRPDLSAQQLYRTRQLMDAHIRDAIVTDYVDLIATVELPDPNDRHVLAAAIKSQSDTILTFNLKDFPSDSLSKHACIAAHPDLFILELMNEAPKRCLQAMHMHRSSLKSPSYSVEDYLSALKKQGLPRTVEELTKYSDAL